MAKRNRVQKILRRNAYRTFPVITASKAPTHVETASPEPVQYHAENDRKAFSPSMRRGDMYYATLLPTVGSEQSGCRPVVVLQNNIGNEHAPTVIIASITSYKPEKKKLPTHVCVDSVLPCKSVVLLEQIRTIDKSRLSDYIGRLDDSDMCRINQCLCISLGLTQGKRMGNCP